jgi:tetratricopeptide (TPR) repeat protein
MKRILVAFLIVVLLYPLNAIGEIQTITHTVKQSFGGSQSPDDARIAAVAKAKREALELVGTYVESTTVVKNAQVEKDEILALTAGVLKAEVVSQKNYTTGDAFGIEVTVMVAVDTALLEARLKKVLEDRTHFEQLKQARAREKELLEKIAALEKENRKSGKSEQKSASLKKEFQTASQGLTAVDWYNKAVDLWSDERFTDPGKAIEYLNEAIRLKPDYAEAYGNRGIAYVKLGQYQRAIQDYDTAIRLKPDDAIAVAVYNNRGLAYAELGQYQRAIQDYDTAIRLKPDYAMAAYYNRGDAYANLGQHQRAIQDYDTAIRLKLNDAKVYNNRGFAYAGLGQYQRAIQDFDTAIRLKPDYAEAYNNRGFVYDDLGQYQRAIQNYDIAIRLKPDYAEAYNNRGNAYNDLGQYQRAIQDFDTAIRLKPDDAMAYYNRGNAYVKLGQYQRAIQDYDTAIRLKPDYVMAYNNRGIAYILSGNGRDGCPSLLRACALGNCKGYEHTKQNGVCR